MLRNFNMVCMLSDVNKIYPNLTFSSSQTPSVCQYKNQSLVAIIIVILVHYNIIVSQMKLKFFTLYIYIFKFLFK